jgi:UDP-N-acetylmuramoylalanine--D-glutamate ligase
MDLHNRIVTIVGAARSGIAAANLALASGADVRITDTRPLSELEAALKGLRDRSRVQIESGGHTPAFIQASDYVVASPGVWRDALALQWARAQSIPVIGEIEFAWRFCRKPVVAVTGSNGKTTTVTLIARVLEAGGKKVCLCGNIGQPFSQYVSGDQFDVFVVEISSFQLELTETFRPYVALITNFSQNHLDRHPDMQDYFEAKKKIFRNQESSDYALINAQDEWSRGLPEGLKAGIRYFNAPEEKGNPNQTAAAAVGRIFGVTAEVARGVFDSFAGVEHRLEKVRLLDGVEYINDSKSTTVESGRWALANTPGPLVLICGGHDKGMDYRGLRELVRATVKVMIVLTREDAVRKTLREAFEGVVPLEEYTDMSAAVLAARRHAAAGQKVLLSPMFASYDMFDNFEQRGRVFKDVVNSL